jgi:hypothetical protein
MEDTLALGLVSALLFIAFYLLGKRLVSSQSEPDTDGNKGGDEGIADKAFGVQGRQLMIAGIVSGFASVAAQLLLTAKIRPAATVFVQDPPF